MYLISFNLFVVKWFVTCSSAMASHLFFSNLVCLYTLIDGFLFKFFLKLLLDAVQTYWHSFAVTESKNRNNIKI